jgi:hypothetical protein
LSIELKTVLAAGGESAAAVVEEHGGVGGGAGPAGALSVDPVRVRLAQLGVQLHLAGLAALAVEADGALAGRPGDVVEIEADGFGDAAAGVERRQRQRSVAGGGCGADGAQPEQDRLVVQRAGREGGQFEPVGSRGAEAGAGVEVVDGGQGVVDGGVAALEHRGEVVR